VKNVFFLYIIYHLTGIFQKSFESFEVWCWRSSKDRVGNEEVLQEPRRTRISYVQ